MQTPPSTRKTKPPTVPYICLAALLLGVLLYQMRAAIDILPREKVTIPSIEPAMASASLETVSPEAEKAGLHRGDVLLAINGKPYTGTLVLAMAIAEARPGQEVFVTVRSAAGVHTVALPATVGQNRIPDMVLNVLVGIVMPTVCLLLGSWVVLARPRDMLAWLLLAVLLGFSELLGVHNIENWGPGWRELGKFQTLGIAPLLGTLWPLSMFFLGMYFPEQFPPGNRMRRIWKWTAWILAPPFVVFSIALVVTTVLAASNYVASARVYRILHPLLIPYQALTYVFVSSFFTAIFTKSAMAISQDARRRLRLLYWGTTVAMTPGLIVTIVNKALGPSASATIPSWLNSFALLMLLIFPLTLAYVIVVQRAMDVRVVLRQSLQYGLARSGIRIFQFVAIAVVVGTAFALAGNSNRLGKMIVIAVAITVGLGIPRLGEQLRTWTDRRFFREAYNAEQVLSELSDQVRGMVETRPLIETVATRIADTLHIPHVAVLLSNDGTYRTAYALGYGTLPEVVFSSGAGAVKVLQKQKEPARVYFDDPNSWLYREPEVSEEDRSNLSQLQSELLLPLGARDKLLGFISLGSKRSDEPYSGTDVRLLKSVAAQTGLALENARLMSAIADEVAHRERLNREVEIAREVQERLFPQTLPPIDGIDYAGACRPALGVGGDYFDFLALPGGQLGIAIGDVSGKGIAAALTMASLQASLRGEASRMTDDLAALVSNVNRLVYEASSANRYATFFYGQYNPVSRQLNYVNAGHNPPMLFHRAAGDWQLCRLETGGTVVGLLESFPYQQATLTVVPGDILVAFTDGVSEAMNAAYEEWGEERMMEAIRGCADLQASEMIARIMQAADAFVAGAKQHDDMTLVVIHARSARGQ
ncbi:MAG TPA: SpoIIE family protein phosphatase [Terriglobales bacterium]|nr:SpoIIE family protein phosphatase [Terriglobales bacterium]